MRIEVGYGLEPILPDGLAGSVIRETCLPRFRVGDYQTGILEGSARVIEIVRKHETLTSEQRAALDAAAAEASKSWGMAALLAVFISAGAVSLGIGVGARMIVEATFGLAVTGGVLYLSTFESPRSAVWLLTLVAVVAAAGGYRLAIRRKWRRRFRGSARGHGWIAQGSSETSGLSSDSGSSSSSDFGGGSSGGGGASGHW